MPPAEPGAGPQLPALGPRVNGGPLPPIAGAGYPARGLREDEGRLGSTIFLVPPLALAESRPAPPAPRDTWLAEGSAGGSPPARAPLQLRAAVAEAETSARAEAAV